MVHDLCTIEHPSEVIKDRLGCKIPSNGYHERPGISKRLEVINKNNELLP
uniref:Uncharacterized protein n=1 Tax=Rhizophora mucronata TaxID=61149 RepID=A0A2P2MYT8_RHIMU